MSGRHSLYFIKLVRLGKALLLKFVTVDTKLKVFFYILCSVDKDSVIIIKLNHLSTTQKF